jgi:hypothetical protein
MSFSEPPRCRSTLAVEQSNNQEALYLLGLPPEHQENIAASAATCGAAILQPLPANHWLISASEACVTDLLTSYPGLTAVSIA